MLLLRLRHRRLSTAYALGPGVLDAQWHDMNDADMEGMLKDEECRYETPCTGVNLNKMNHTVYNSGVVGLCMASRAIYNTAFCFFFSMNFFRCLDFADLEDFLYHVRHVHMIQRIQVAWKGGGTPIAKAIHRLQKSATGLAELRLIVGNEDSEAMLTQPAWRLMCETARQEKWQVHLDGEAECWLKARQQLGGRESKDNLF